MNTMMALVVAAAAAGGAGAQGGARDRDEPRTVEASPPDDGMRPAISFELRGGVGTGEYHAFGSAGERTAGGNWRVQLSYSPLPYAAVYAGYGRASFGCEGGFCAQAPVTFAGSGFDAGVLLGWRMLWLQAGVLGHALDAEWQGPDGSTRERASSRTGVTAAAGVDIPVAAGFSIAPGVRWARHGAAFPPAPSGDVVHVMADVGLRYRIPVGR
jgi:hypothetical protein